MSEQFDSVMEGLNDLMEYAKGDKSKARLRVREAPFRVKSLKQYTKDDIKKIRTNFNLSQRLFADVLGVSSKTVEAWESGINTPAGSSSRIIELLEKDSQLLEHYDLVADAQST